MGENNRMIPAIDKYVNYDFSTTDLWSPFRKRENYLQDILISEVCNKFVSSLHNLSFLNCSYTKMSNYHIHEKLCKKISLSIK